MKLRLIQIRDALSDSFWFLPALMALLAGGAALGSVALDHTLGSGWVQSMGWVWSGGADGARGVLSVIAGSVMTVVSIVFSLTISALAQTSSHFGPRVLRNFTSDRRVQFTLGTFISTFVYCLLVLRTVRSVEELSFVPYLSINLGVLLALASLAVLIFFIHHISQSIQAENLIAEVGEDFEASLKVLFPERIGEPQNATSNHGPPDEKEWQDALQIHADENGYLQRVDDEQLMKLAVQGDCVFKLEKRPGDFVASGSPLLRVLASSDFSPENQGNLRACFSLGRYRTPHQDLLYSIQQLVEIAAHALSPGINEPFTALTCIDWLGTSLRGVAERDLPSPLRRDEAGQLRVIVEMLDFGQIARASFDQIRIYGASNPDIMLNLLRIIAEIAPVLHRSNDRDALIEHAHLIGTDAAQIENEADRGRVAQKLRDTLQSLSQSGTKAA